MLAAPDHGLSTPSGIVGANERPLLRRQRDQRHDQRVRCRLAVRADRAAAAAGRAHQPTKTYLTGTPLGITVDENGTLYYADIGIIIRPSGPGPGNHIGSVRRITFNDDGKPNPPETIADNLQFPDGLGLWSR